MLFVFMFQKYQAKEGTGNVSCSTKELRWGKSIVLHEKG